MKYKIGTKIFIEGLKNNLNNKEKVMGCRIDQLVEAALHLLNEIPYEGDDKKVKQFIACELKVF